MTHGKNKGVHIKGSYKVKRIRQRYGIKDPVVPPTPPASAGLQISYYTEEKKTTPENPVTGENSFQAE
jgi:hypothetical protein